jgi:hypothetical protein
MNAGAIFFIILTVIVAGFAVFVFSPLGKKAFFDPDSDE